MSWPTSGIVAPDFSHSTLRSSSGDGGSGSSSFFTHAGVPWAFRRLSQGRLLGVCCFSGCWPWAVVEGGAAEQEETGGSKGERRRSWNRGRRRRERLARSREPPAMGSGVGGDSLL